MKFSFILTPTYNQYKKNAHVIATKLYVEKIINLLAEYANLKLSVFFTGKMLEVLATELKKEAKQLNEFVLNKRVECLGGSYNDAMLPLFPDNLINLQLQKHKELLTKLFAEPSGYFCPSNAWEISLIKNIEKNDFTYVLMPDTSVQTALGRKSSVSGWFAAEYGGSFTRILTYSEELSANIQNLKSEEIIDSLKKYKEWDNINCILLNINLNDKTQNNEWLQAIDALEAEKLNAEHYLLRSSIEQKATGKVNLISYSNYAASCRDILLRMPEINFLHKRLLNIYFKANSLNDSQVKEKIFERLLNAMQQDYFKNTKDAMQNNITRFYAHRDVMKAEKILGDFEALDGIRLAMHSFFLDGYTQLILSNSYLGCLIEPAFGGFVRSLSYKPAFSELACSMRDDNEVSPLFLDHICPFEFENLDQRNLWISDRLGAFLGSYETSTKKQENKMQILMHGEQNISYLGKDYLFKVEKVFGLKNNNAELLLSISIVNNSFNAFNGEIATELCLGFRNDNRGQSLKIGNKKVKAQAGNSFYENVKNIIYRDRVLSVGAEFEMNKNADILYAPILGSSSVAAPSIIQGLRIVIFRKAELKGQESETFHLRVKLNGGGFFV